MNYLYEKFLKDKKVYNLNEAFYKRLLAAVIGNTPTLFFNNKFANNEKIYDSHIFNTKYNNRILQIIQHPPTSKSPYLTTVFKQWDGNQEMLVLNIELAKELIPLLKKTIVAWLIEKKSQEEIKKTIQLELPFVMKKNKAYKISGNQRISSMVAENDSPPYQI